MKLAPALLLLAAGCATSAQTRSAPETTTNVVESSTANRTPPAFFSRKPWRTVPDGHGDVDLVQLDAQIQFPRRAGRLDRVSVKVFDEGKLDVGVEYRGALAVGLSECLIVLSVFVYPANETPREHLAAVEKVMLARSPNAQPASTVLALDQADGGEGAHAAFTDVAGGARTLEQASVYRRGSWFVTYRVSMAPADQVRCEREIRDAVAALRIPSH